jgi:P pilus assembly chaperone PapD
MKNKRLIILSILLAACFWSLPAKAQFDISLSPILVQIDLVPGARKTFALYLNNENTQKTVNMIAYTMDIEETLQGAYKVLEEGESEFSCADWMIIQDSSFTLKPGESREIKVQMVAPPNAFGGRYGAVVFEVVPDAGPTGEKLGSVQYHFRMPAFVEVSVKRFGGITRKASVSDFKVKRVTNPGMLKELGGAGLSFTASVKNEGNIHLDGKGTLIIKDQSGRTKRRVPLGGGRGIVIPGATVEFQSLLKEPPTGEYIARAIINFGGLSPTIAEVPFVVSRTRSSVSGSFKASSALAMDVKPENLEIKIPHKGFRAATFSFRNNERDTIFVKTRIAELGFGMEGDLLTLDSSETGRSCKDWISVEPTAFNVPPEKSTQVRFTLQAPAQGEGGYYACLVFDALLKDVKENIISTPFEIPVITNIPPNQKLSGEIPGIEISATAGKPALVTAYFKNSGNVHVKPQGKGSLTILRQVKPTGDITYVGKSGYEKIGELEFEEIDQYVLPGEIRKMMAAYPGALEKGKYTAEIDINYGGAETAKFSKEFQVK